MAESWFYCQLKTTTESLINIQSLNSSHLSVFDHWILNLKYPCMGNNIVVVLLVHFVLVKICHIMTQKGFMLYTTIHTQTFDPSSRKRLPFILTELEPSWLYGSWIYNYLCNHCLCEYWFLRSIKSCIDRYKRL
jgi:hypothetical protein